MEARGTLARATGAGLLLLSLVLSGCVSMPMWNENAPPAPVIASSLATIWRPDVRFESNPFQGGVPFPGLAGRVLLYSGESGVPVVSDGAMDVELWDASAKPEVLMEMWKFDKDTLKRSLKKDVIGWGYTVFLPWTTYRQDITKVHLRVTYKQAKSNDIFSHDSPMALNHEPVEVSNTSSTYVPPVNQQSAPAVHQQVLPMPARVDGALNAGK